ncbi:MAG: arginine decarboxylase, pyruvoyl-dependent [Candidatus Methanofastidiosum sp.]|nr:arginine decarboxylase, pyruvoyl-dependent [Methanofastidiosum sp.]NYT03162.1 arginine decarboxylase, pyruvoyl-dependent [Candidatus Methanofastidiosa archaeon]
MVPKRVFFVKGKGVHKDKLQSFELALREAGIEKCNLVYVSSILPPYCEIIPREEGLKCMKAGQITFCVMARNATDEPNRQLSAAVGLAVPAEKGNYGYLSEVHMFGYDEKFSGDYAEDLAATMLATTLGIDFNPDTAWDERNEIYKASGKIIDSESIAIATKGDSCGKWTTVIAAAIFLLD